MKKSVKKAIAATLGLSAAIAVISCGSTKVVSSLNEVKAASPVTAYVPGKANKNDAVKDLNKQGFYTTPEASKHYSLIDAGGKKVLRFDVTQDNAAEAVILPLSGNEKKVTVLFKEMSSFDPDTVKVDPVTGKKTGTPFSAFYAYVMKGSQQTLLRHNASNQVKGSKSSSRLTEDGSSKTPKLDIVSDWHDFRMVFDVADPAKMTAECYIDGKKVHSDICKTVNTDSEFNLQTPVTDSDHYLGGSGNYLEFGDNDGSTMAFGRFAYIVVILDEDVPMDLAQAGAKYGLDLVTAPSVDADKTGPKSKKPEKKPAEINMQAAEIGKGAGWTDKSAIENKTINLDSLPYSKNKAEKIDRAATAPALKFAATVDASGANGAYKTIAAAIDAVQSGSAIKVMPGTYQEKLLITKPGITLVGENPANTIIYGYEADTGGIDGNILVEVNYLPTGTKTEPGVKAPVPAKPVDNCYFNAVNITFYNKGAEWNKAWGGAERRSIALGLKGVDQCYLKNCVFLGQQDTIYWRSGRVYAENCYFEGEVDFICGGATALFDNCHIHSIPYANGAIIVAAAGADTGYTSTKNYATGYVFRNCLFTADKSYDAAKDGKKITAGRGSWVGGSAAPDVQAKTIYINNEFNAPLNASVWADWDSVNTAAKALFRGYKNKGTNGAALDSKWALSEAEYKATYDDTQKILGFKPELK